MFKGVKQIYLDIQKMKNKITNKFPYHLDLFKNEQNIHLGRWGNHHNKNLKIDYNNVDHCGPCGNEKIDNTQISQISQISQITKKH